MSATQFGITAYLAIAMLAAPGIATPRPTTTAAKANAETREVSKFLRDIAADARAVRVQARQVEKLAGRGAPSYQAYDKHWNEMKPKVEEMSLKLDRLARIRESALPWQQEAIDRSARLINQISSNTEKLRTFLNQGGNNLSAPMLRTYGRTLAQEAHQLALAVQRPAGQGHLGKALGMKKGS